MGSVTPEKLRQAYERGWNDSRRRGMRYHPFENYTEAERQAYRDGFNEGTDQKIEALIALNHLAKGAIT